MYRFSPHSPGFSGKRGILENISDFFGRESGGGRTSQGRPFSTGGKLRDLSVDSGGERQADGGGKPGRRPSVVEVAVSMKERGGISKEEFEIIRQNHLQVWRSLLATTMQTSLIYLPNPASVGILL